MKKLNKKGFTLVELLAVIVILALLIVVVATSVLPALDNSKKSSLNVYAGRVLNNAKQTFQTEVLNNNHDTFEPVGSVTSKYCTKMSSLMGTNKQYYGLVLVDDSGTEPVYYVQIIDGPNKLSYTKTVSNVETPTALKDSLLGVSRINKITSSVTDDPECPDSAEKFASAITYE